MCAFKFKATASDAEVIPQRPGECDDEAYEHPENRKCRFADKRRHDHRKPEPEFKLRVHECKEVVHEVEVQCREKLVLRNERCELVRVLDFENGGENEHASNADAAKCFKSADGKILLDLDGREDECASENDGANANVDVVAVCLRPNVEEPFLVGESENRFGETDFGNADGHKKCRDEKEDARDNGILEIFFFKTCNHRDSLKNVCRLFEDILGANPIDGFGVIDADVVDDGECDAECCNAEQDNPI